MRKIFFICLSFLLFFSLFFSTWGVLAEHYYGRDDRYHEHGRSDDAPRSYHRDSYGSYTSTVESYPTRHYRHIYSEPEYSESTEAYYSCPRGDYISDRPGRCPLDGSILVSRASVQRSPIRYKGTTYSEY